MTARTQMSTPAALPGPSPGVESCRLPFYDWTPAYREEDWLKDAERISSSSHPQREYIMVLQSEQREKTNR